MGRLRVGDLYAAGMRIGWMMGQVQEHVQATALTPHPE